MKKVSEMFCEKGYDLLFSPCNRGMLAICYETFKNKGRSLYGYTIEEYKSSMESLTDVSCEIEPSSFDRLKAFYNDADVFVFMPGGSGTLGEIFGVVEEAKNNLQDKKIILYNFEGFYNSLLSFIDDCKEKKFISEKDLMNLKIVNDFEELKNLI